MAANTEEATVKLGVDGKDAVKTIKHVISGFEDMKHAVEAIAGVELFKAAREFGNIILEKLKGPSEYADRLLSMSAAAGVGVEALQKLQFSAQQNGVSAENASMSLVHLNRTLEGAREGSKEAMGAFAQLGISQERVKGFADADDALMAITDSLKNLPDPVKRSALAMQLFGRSGASQLKWLASGSAEMREMKERAEALGAVVSAGDTTALNEMGDAVESVGAALKAFVSTITARVAPVVLKLVHVLEDWWIANRKIIQSGIETWVRRTIIVLAFMVGLVEGLVERFMGWAQTIHLVFKEMAQLAEDGVMAVVNAVGAFIEKIQQYLKDNESFVDAIIETAETAGLVAAGFFLWANASEFAALAQSGLLTVMTNVGGAMKTALQFLRGGLVSALTTVGNIIKTIASHITLANLSMLATFGLLVLLGLELKSIYDQIFNGKKFEDTTFGKLIGFAGKKFGELTSGDNATGGPLAGGMANIAQLANTAAANSGSASFAPPDTSGIADMAMSLIPQNMTINAPVTLNAPEGADPDQMKKGVSEGIADHMKLVYAAAARAKKPNVRH